ncbi:MAG: hypothetical protein U0166_25085 [Acidobacteriota bacterium]
MTAARRYSAMNEGFPSDSRARKLKKAGGAWARPSMSATISATASPSSRGKNSAAMPGSAHRRWRRSVASSVR